MKTRSVYDQWSSQYDRCSNPMLAAADEALLAVIPTLAGRELIEFGCGTARNYPNYQSRGATRIVGLDFSAGMLEQARKRYPDLEFAVHDIADPTQLGESSFDCAVFSLVLEHVKALQPCFREAHRLLRKSGHLVVCEMHPFLGLQGAGAHFHDSDGAKVYAETYVHSMADLIQAGMDEGFCLEAIRESQKPTGSTKWMGSPLAVALRFVKLGPAPKA
jgi:ubiquinone/menaquinone biosynthesis C-methylase UbiE